MFINVKRGVSYALNDGEFGGRGGDDSSKGKKGQLVKISKFGSYE